MKKIAVCYLLILVSLPALAKYSATRFPFTSWCSVYPTAYVSGSFALNETSRNGKSGFLPGQNNVTLIFGFSGAFEFRPGIGIVTATGTEVTIHSYTISATSITVNLSTGPSNLELNSIQFNNIEIRATGTSSGYIRRTGGTMRIDNKASNPFATYSMGDLVAEAPAAYASNGTTQASTADVFAGSTGNEILRVSITLSGTCSSIPVTSFTFNTTGSTNATNDISSASLYYSGDVNSFSTANLFGSVANPNGSFTIIGNQHLDLGGTTYYFWLVYDIRLTATVNNVVDAVFSSAFVDGSSRAATGGAPAGSRRITADTYYSIATGNWTTTTVWSRTSGGPSCSCAPVNGGGFVFVNHPVALNGSYTVDFVTIQSGGNLTNTAGSVLTVRALLSTTGSGSFNATSSWVTPNLTTSGNATSTFSSAFSHSGNLIIGGGTTLQALSGAGLTVNGNFELDGTLALGTSNMSMGGSGSFVRGTGTINGSGIIQVTGNRPVLTGSYLTVFPVIAISSNVIITNNGSVITHNNITGANGNSTWTNNSNSLLEVSGTTAVLLSTGSLAATAAGNTVRYTGSGDQPVKATTYHHLYFGSTGNGTKTLAGAVTVNGNLSIEGNARLATSNNTIAISGNWINNSSNTIPFAAGTGTVSFAGTTSILGTGTTNFNIVSITSAGVLVGHGDAGRVRVAGNWINLGEFEHNESDITFNGTSQITSPSGFATSIFYNLIVASGNNLTLNATETGVEGNLLSFGTLSHNNGLLFFQGDGVQLVGGLATLLILDKVEIDNSGAGVTLERPLTVNTSLTLTNGTLNTTAGNILLMIAGSSATSASASSFVNGPMTKVGNTAFVFPIGKNTRRGRLAIDASATAARSFTAEYFDQPYATLYPATTPLHNVSGLEHWSLTRNASADAVRITLYFDNATASDINNCPDLTMARWDGSAWIMVPATTSGLCTGSGSGSVASIGTQSAFGFFTFASGSSLVNILPVELLKFEALLNNNLTVNVRWSTASELNSDFFLVEKSKDGRIYEEVARVVASGMSNELKNYFCADEYPFSGVSYYRLKQVDLNGSESYSSLARVSFTGQFTFSVYPNPAPDGNLWMRINGNKHDEVRVSVLDMNNRIVYRDRITLRNENDIINIAGLSTAIPPGVYIIRVENESVIHRQKLIIN